MTDSFRTRGAGPSGVAHGVPPSPGASGTNRARWVPLKIHYGAGWQTAQPPIVGDGWNTLFQATTLALCKTPTRWVRFVSAPACPATWRPTHHLRVLVPGAPGVLIDDRTGTNRAGFPLRKACGRVGKLPNLPIFINDPTEG